MAYNSRRTVHSRLMLYLQLSWLRLPQRFAMKFALPIYPVSYFRCSCSFRPFTSSSFLSTRCVSVSFYPFSFIFLSPFNFTLFVPSNLISLPCPIHLFPYPQSSLFHWWRVHINADLLYASKRKKLWRLIV